MTPQRSEAVRKEDILAAAARLFQQRGYAATSVDDIASELGIVKGSLYYHIRGKADLLLEIVAEVHHALVDAQASRPRQDDVVGAIRDFIVTHTEVLAALHYQSAVFYLEVRSLRPDDREQIRRWRVEYQNQLVGLIEDGKEQGRLAGATSSGLAARSILGMINSMHWWYEPDGPIRPTSLGNSFADMALLGLVGRVEE